MAECTWWNEIQIIIIVIKKLFFIQDENIFSTNLNKFKLQTELGILFCRGPPQGQHTLLSNEFSRRQTET